MKRINKIRPAIAATVLLGVAVGVGPASHVAAQACGEVVSFARGTSTVGRVDASSGAALAAPAVYSSLIQDTIPSVAFNQSGPTTLGQLEDPTGTNPNTFPPTAWGFMPVDPPAPTPRELFGPNPPFVPAAPSWEGRAEAAYPTLEGIPQDSENSFGSTQAEAHAYPTYSEGRASSAGLGGVDGGVRSGSAFTKSVLECETLTLIVGWEANGLVTPGGDVIPSMNQVATLVISPDGATADVVTNVAEETESGIPIIDGKPADNELFAGLAENGTYIEVGEPTVTAEGNRATVSGGGVFYGTRDPERNDTYTFYKIGSLTGLVEFVSVLPPFEGAPEQAAPPVAAPAAAPPAQQSGQTTKIIRTAGDAPAPSAAAEQFAATQVQLAGLTEDLTTGSFSLWPILLALIALALISRTAWYAADHGRERFPTAGFTVDWMRVRGQRFATTYLEW